MSKLKRSFNNACNYNQFETAKRIYSEIDKSQLDDVYLKNVFISLYRKQQYHFAEWIATIYQWKHDDPDSVLNVCKYLHIDAKSVLDNFTTTDTSVRMKILHFITSHVQCESSFLHNIFCRLIDTSNDTNEIKVMLKIGSFSCYDYNEVLSYAHSKNRLDIVRLIVNDTTHSYELQDIMCKSTNTEIFDLFVSCGVNINLHRNKLLKQIFHCNNAVLVKHLIRNKIYVDVNKGYGFRFACRNGNIKMAKLLYHNSLDIRAKKDTGFKLACRGGHIEIVKWLIDLGVDIHIGNEYGLRWAIAKDSYNMVEFLIELGADIHALDDWAFKKIVRNYEYSYMFKLLHGIDNELIVKYVSKSHISKLDIVTSDSNNAKLLHEVFCEQIIYEKMFDIDHIDEICVQIFAHHNRIDCLEYAQKYFPYITYIVQDGVVVDYSVRPLPKNARFT